jgi:putative DNA primase/helicase
MLGLCRAGRSPVGRPNVVRIVDEGIETCLAVMLATGNPVWAALSTVGLRTVDLPDTVCQVIALVLACPAALRGDAGRRRVRRLCNRR